MVSADPPPRRLRVLVADDNRDSADTMALLVRLWGHETATYYDGQAALAAVLAAPPDVAILDLAMPKLNGVSLAACVREATPPNQILLIAVTAFPGPKVRRQAANVGFDHYLVKPCEPFELRLLLEERQAALIGKETVFLAIQFPLSRLIRGPDVILVVDGRQRRGLPAHFHYLHMDTKIHGQKSWQAIGKFPYGQGTLAPGRGLVYPVNEDPITV